MNIFIISSTFHPTIGGAESYALMISQQLAKLNHKVFVITDKVDGQKNIDHLGQNSKVLRLHNYRNNINAKDKILWEEMQFGLFSELEELALKEAPDVVITNSLDTSILGKNMSLTMGIPWIAVFHEHAPENDAFGNSKIQIAYQFLHPDVIIAGSKFYLNRAEKFNKSGTNILIYHGIDTETFSYNPEAKKEIQKKYGISEDALILVSSGRLKARKGFLYVLDMMKELVASNIDVFLIICGTLNSASKEYYLEMQQKIQDLKISDSVSIEVNASHFEIPTFLSAADIVIQASLEEGLGLAVLEAMACSRPVVTTKINGVNEIFSSQHIGIQVEPANSAELVKAVKKLLNNPSLRESIGDNARKHVVQCFSINTMTHATEKTILKAIKNNEKG